MLSDSHDQRSARPGRGGLAGRPGAEVLIHCGDLTTSPRSSTNAASRATVFVFGNNDYDEIGLRAAMAAIGATCLGRGGELELGGKRIAVTHGDSASEARRLLALQPDYFLYGHTHTPDDGEGMPRWINPGALHRAARYTVALLDLDDGRLEFLGVP
ncbi:MAG: metallophosphoesterase family protein [Isosphaeraceae bacterium]